MKPGCDRRLCHVTDPRRFSSALMIMRKSLLIKTLLIAAGLPLLAGCIVERQPRRVVVVEQPAPAGEVIVETPAALPPPRIEVQPVSPGPEYIWIGGGWEWRAGWIWAPGHWVIRPRPRAAWAVGHWERHPRGYVWVEGRWRCPMQGSGQISRRLREIFTRLG